MIVERKCIDIEVLSDYGMTCIHMKIGRTEYEDGGQYKILAKNKYGEAEYLLDLRVTSKVFGQHPNSELLFCVMTFHL